LDQLEQATVMDDPLLAVCVGLSKAYDAGQLDLLEFLLCGSGLPADVWRPMLDMAKARRRIRVVAAAHLGHAARLPRCHLRHVPAPGAVVSSHSSSQPHDESPVLG
jgi:hypothetical protein